MDTDDSYKTIAAIAEGTYTEKRSKFLAFALPVETTSTPTTTESRRALPGNPFWVKSTRMG